MVTMDNSAGTPSVDINVRNWNALREHGAPSWVAKVARTDERLAAIAREHPGAGVEWVSDPTGDGADVRIPVLEFGNRAGPTTLVVGGMHGREPATSAVVLDWAESLLRGSAAGEPVTSAVLGANHVVVVPQANPRGVAGALAAIHGAAEGPAGTNEDLGGFPDDTPDPTPLQRFMWQRKNQKPGQSGGGVDLNRNFSATFFPDDSGRPERHSYQGVVAASEPETRILEQVIARTRPVNVVDVHQYADFMAADRGSGVSQADAAATLHRMSTASGIPVDDTSSVGFTDPVPPTLAGTMTQHAARTGSELGITIEMGDSFLPTQEQYEGLSSSVGAALTALVQPAARERAPARTA